MGEKMRLWKTTVSTRKIMVRQPTMNQMTKPAGGGRVCEVDGWVGGGWGFGGSGGVYVDTTRLACVSPITVCQTLSADMAPLHRALEHRSLAGAVSVMAAPALAAGMAGILTDGRAPAPLRAEGEGAPRGDRRRRRRAAKGTRTGAGRSGTGSS